MKLDRSALGKVDKFMNTNARALERDIYNYYFNRGSKEKILKSLKHFQNEDGGFGKGIEPDFKLVESSPMATSIGLRYLSRIDYNGEADEMINKAVQYLERTFDKERKGWYSVPKEVNNYPHAFWWDYKEDINMTIIDYSWGNPTAEIIGYLYKYKKNLKKLDVNNLIEIAIETLNNRKEFKSEHEVFCYIRLYNSLDIITSERLENGLKLAVDQLMNVDELDWESYVPTPLKFIEFDSDNYFGISQKLIDKELDYVIAKLKREGKIIPTWEWNSYPDIWDKSKVEWTGVKTMETLLDLMKFDRIAESC